MTIGEDRPGQPVTASDQMAHGPDVTTIGHGHSDSSVMVSTRVRRKPVATMPRNVRGDSGAMTIVVGRVRRVAGARKTTAPMSDGAVPSGRNATDSDGIGRLVRHAAVSGAVRGRLLVVRRVGHDKHQENRRGVRVETINSVVEQEVAVSNRQMTIAIDGPAAAGKSTVGEIVAQKIDGVYFDTGVLYRALTLLALEHGVAPSDETSLADLAVAMDIHVGRPTVSDGRQVDVFLDGRDVTHSLRTPAIDRNVSAVSAHRAVRNALLGQQRRIGRSGRVVMVGRDIGTVVLPGAELKIFLDASPEERARRRCLQLEQMGRSVPYEEVLADMKRRDRIDSERDVAPLRPADDAFVIDSDSLTIEQVADLIVSHAQRRLATVR